MTAKKSTENIDWKWARRIIKLALSEDAARTDVTTRGLVGAGVRGKGVFVAREEGVLAGGILLDEIYRQLGSEVEVDGLLAEGARLRPGRVVARVEGPLRTLLAAERTALNFLQRLSGVATLTRRFVQAVEGTRVKVYDTRKTSPGLRHLEKYAVRVGGGFNHRKDLARGVMVKDTHWGLIRRLPDGESRLRRLVRCSRGRREIVIEVRDLKELETVLPLRPEVVMLDNMSLATIRRAVGVVRRLPPGERPLVEVSGGITLNNAARVARSGVDRISVGALTHSAPALDIAFELVG